MTSLENTLARAFCALQGLAIGDALGAYFEFTSGRVPAQTLAKNYDRSRGYGSTTRMILSRIRQGQNWSIVAKGVFNNNGSYGDGSMARAAVVGAYFADDLNKAIEEVRKSTEVIHAHDEAITGAIAIAVAVVMAYQNTHTKLSTQTFLDLLLSHIPQSDIRKKLILARDLPSETAVTEAVAFLGNGSNVSAQDTVPFALWCAGKHLYNFEEAIWLTLSGLGDCDTTGSITGGIVASSVGPEGIPDSWVEACEPLGNSYRA